MLDHKIILVGCILMASNLAWAEKSEIIAQEDSPIKITAFTANHKDSITLNPDGSLNRQAFRELLEYGDAYKTEKIFYKVSVSNTSGKNIVAYRVGIATFGVFNNIITKFGGISSEGVSANGTETARFANDAYAAFRFKKYGTGVAYVDAVRFEDGTIWRADMAKILNELKKYQKDLKPEDLEEKEKK